MGGKIGAILVAMFAAYAISRYLLHLLEGPSIAITIAAVIIVGWWAFRQ